MNTYSANNDEIYNEGERYVPWRSGIERLEHYARYYFALGFVENKKVLDIACGEGYGSALLAQSSKTVIGVDISPVTISHAQKKYSNLKNLSFREGNVDNIPLNDKSVDIVVSFETLEHISNQVQMLAEMRRVLVDDGLLVLSTPEKSNYLAESKFENVHHIKELSIDELKELISKYFVHSRYYYQFVTLSSAIIPDNIESGGNIINDNKDSDFGDKHIYNVVVASNGDLPSMKGIGFQSVVEGRKLLLKEKEIYKSRTYRLGHFLTYPIRIIRYVFKG